MNRSRAWLIAWGGAALTLASLPAQTIRVYSELQRIDPFGKVVAADSGPAARPREILSPAVVRNAYASFHVAVTAPAGMDFTLYVGQNPEGSFRVSVYKEIFSQIGGAWIPDALEPVTLPHKAAVPDAPRKAPGQTTAVFWMDVWVPRSTKVSRIKLQPQIWADGRWVIYPMEVRVLAAIVFKPELPPTLLGALQLSADATIRDALRCHLCGCEPRMLVAGRSIRRMILRNVAQDLALVRSIQERHGRAVAVAPILKVLGAADAREWCEAPVFPRESGAEWYLKVRDAVYVAASR